MLGGYSGIHFGGDYNPDQWDPALVDEDIALMKEAGVTLVTPAVFSWARIEPREGEYDFAWLDEVMDKLADAGIHADLATATASPPPWLGKEYPETLPVTRDGVVLRWGSRQQYNPSSAKFRSACAELVTQLATRYAEHPALAMWHVGNEYACHVAESYDAESADGFRAWLRQRYGSLDELNRVWGTSFWSQRYDNWDEVIPPGPMPTFHNPGHVLDWRRYSADAILACFTNEVRILREITPNIPITTNFMGMFPTLDYWKWADAVDVVSNDSYPDPADPRAARILACESDLMRSLAAGKPFVQMEQTPSAVQWRPQNTPKRPGQFALWSTQLVARGADGVCQFQWRQSASGSEMFHSAMVPHAGTQSPVWNDMVDTGAALRRLPDAVGKPVAARVAIVWDWENAWAVEAAIGPVEASAFDAAQAWHASLYERGYAVDFVRPGGDLSGYSLVIVPTFFYGIERLHDRLKEALAAGVCVVVTHGSGYVDRDGHAFLGGYLAPVSDLLGVRVVDILPRGEDTPALPASARISGQVETWQGCEVRWGAETRDRRALQSSHWAERIAVDDAEVLARFAGLDVDGLPAITRRVFASAEPGNPPGQAWYLGAQLDETGRDAFLSEIERQCGLVPDAGHTPPAGVEVVRRGELTFALNHSDISVRYDQIQGEDLLTGQPYPGWLEPRSAAVVR
ncbi:MAG TPA: beta-galactosidase [Pseudoclavibacter sp.]|nr:beta-galactosidase [Pseudoclavibacter sp.]